MKFLVLLVLLSFTNCTKSQNKNDYKQNFTSPIKFEENHIYNYNGIENSLKKLNFVKDKKLKNFVIVHFGDSHIQMGHFGGRIRTNFQKQFGNAGEGVLFPYSACKSFGPRNLNSIFTGNWEFNNIAKHKGVNIIGISGYNIKTLDTNSTIIFNYIPKIEERKNVTFDNIKIFHGKNNYSLIFKNNFLPVSSSYKDFDISIIDNSNVNFDIQLNLNKINKEQKEFIFNGIIFENSNSEGVLYHQCGVVGATFLNLINNTTAIFSQLEYIKPDLIIFSYGSNESYSKNFNEKNYYKEISFFIEQIKKTLPQADILITTAPDTRLNNNYPDNKNTINSTFKAIAKSSNISIWDLNSVMGGDSSMQIWELNNLANKDNLHFVKKGYELQGDLFSLAFFELFNKKIKNRLNTDSLNLDINNKIKLFQQTKNTIKEDCKKYTVKKRDTLKKIAKKFNCTEKSIIEFNNLKNSKIIVGQVLIIN